MSDQPHPMQPIYLARDGRPRFKENPIVRILLDTGPLDLNHIWQLPNVSVEDIEQFYQLIGYSVGGFGEMSEFSHETVAKADRIAAEIREEKV